MLRLDEALEVHLCLSPTDMRCGGDSLAARVQEYFSRNSLDGCVYVFFSRNRKRVKILQWDGDGYWLHYKRLETSAFRVALREDGKEELTGVDLGEVLRGVDLQRVLLQRKTKKQVQ